MYKKIIFIIVFLLLQDFCIYAQLGFDKKSVDFGTLKQNTTVQTVFYYTNKSKGKIKIKNIYSTCGCTVPLNYKRILKPGEFGKVDVVFNSEQFKGKIIRKVYFETIPAIIPLPELTINSTVIEEFSFSPEMIADISSAETKIETKYVKITSDFYKKFSIVDVKFNKKYFKVDISKISSNKYNAKITIYVNNIKSGSEYKFHKEIIFIFRVKKKKIKKYFYLYF